MIGAHRPPSFVPHVLLLHQSAASTARWLFGLVPFDDEGWGAQGQSGCLSYTKGTKAWDATMGTDRAAIDSCGDSRIFI